MNLNDLIRMNPAGRVQTNLTGAESERQHPAVVMRGRFDFQYDPRTDGAYNGEEVPSRARDLPSVPLPSCKGAGGVKADLQANRPQVVQLPFTRNTCLPGDRDCTPVNRLIPARPMSRSRETVFQ